jgi:hypothetical protein
MKGRKHLFANLKSVALIGVLAGLILVSGLVATKTLITDKSIESSHNVNASTSEPRRKPTPSELAPASGDLSISSSQQVVNDANPNASVWVNTSSGTYHCPKTRWYGNTNKGAYMTQQEAQSKGYRPARGNLCE